jgi:hypothetical protein
MKLSDVRRLCLRRQLRISFRIVNGPEYCINEHGATVLNGQAGVTEVGELFEAATEFRLTLVRSGRSRKISRGALERMTMQTVRKREEVNTA